MKKLIFTIFVFFLFQSIANANYLCGFKPLPDFGCKIGLCVDGEWEQVCDKNRSSFTCGIKPIPDVGCRIGRCVDGAWEQVCY